MDEKCNHYVPPHPQQAQLEHQSLRILNLELMSEYGAASWRSYNGVVANMIDSAQKHLQVSWYHLSRIIKCLIWMLNMCLLLLTVVL